MYIRFQNKKHKYVQTIRNLMILKRKVDSGVHVGFSELNSVLYLLLLKL